MTDPASSPTVSTSALVAALRQNLHPLLCLAAGWLTWTYVGALALLLVWLEWRGEHFALTGALLFAPPLVLLLPLLILAPYCLLARPRLIILQAAAIALVVFGFMGFRWTPPQPARDGEIRLITHNVGQGSRPQFHSFVAAENPDVIALQDARGRGTEFAKKYPAHHVVSRSEFVLISRFPILHSDPVDQAKWFGRPIAARFELLCHDRTLIIYNVHLPTPRQQLNRFLSGRALADLLVEEDSTRRPSTYGEWTRARLKLANELAGVFAREPLPFLVCGDFNTPDHGVIYHTIARHLTDAHLRSGRGWGFTFPGPTSNPFSLRGPWLRIDQAFAGRGWEPISCAPEPGRRSQHCAVVARFIPKT